MVTAVLHLLGATAVLVVVMFISGVVDAHFSRKRLERILDGASAKMDLPRSGVFAGEYNAEIARYLAERYDPDRLANRVSDVGRPAFLAFEWLSYCAQLAIVVVAGWFAFTSDPAYAVSAWVAAPVALALWILSKRPAKYILLSFRRGSDHEAESSGRGAASWVGGDGVGRSGSVWYRVGRVAV